MPFDPSQFGATLVQQPKAFNPADFGATPVKPMSPFNPKAANSQFTQPTPAGATEMQYKPSDKTGLTGNFVKALPKAVGETAGSIVRGPVRLATSVGEGIDQTVKNGGNASGKTYHVPLVGSFQSFQTEAKQTNNPLVPLKVALAGVDTAGLAEGATRLPEAATKVAGLAGKVDVRLGGEAAQKALQANEADALKTTWSKIAPKLKTEADIAEAAKTGQLERTALGGVKQAVPTAGRNLEMTKAAAPYVQNAKDELQMVQNMKQGIADSANTARQGLKDSKAIWNVNELKGKINKIEMPISVKSDATLANTFKNVQAEVLKIAQDAPKTPDGLLDVRQKLDTILENDFGNRIWNKQDGVSQIYKQFRNVLNDLADSKVTDGALKAELKKQSLLYDAIDNVAPKIKVGNPISVFMKKNPTLTKVGGAFIGGASAEEVARRLLK